MKMYKTTFNLSETIADALKAYANKKGITRTEALRRAISIQKFLEEQVSEGGKVIVEKNGKFRELAIL